MGEYRTFEMYGRRGYGGMNPTFSAVASRAGPLMPRRCARSGAMVTVDRPRSLPLSHGGGLWSWRARAIRRQSSLTSTLHGIGRAVEAAPPAAGVEHAQANGAALQLEQPRARLLVSAVMASSMLRVRDHGLGLSALDCGLRPRQTSPGAAPWIASFRVPSALRLATLFDSHSCQCLRANCARVCGPSVGHSWVIAVRQAAVVPPTGIEPVSGA